MAQLIELVDDELIELDGKFKGSKKFLCRKHIFYKKGPEDSNKETYFCSCANVPLRPCKVKITRDAKKKLILNLGKDNGHRHDSVEHVVEILEMIRELKNAAKNPGTPQLIYDRIVPKHRIAAKNISLAKAAGIIIRERKHQWIRNPESMEELGSILTEHHTYSTYFQGILRCKDPGDGTILFFADVHMLKRLNNAKALYLDGNFKIPPKEPQSMQVWNILMDEHGAQHTETYFVAFAWCTNAKQGTYKTILSYLKKIAPDLEKNLETIYTDFEQAAIIAYKDVFPGVKIQGCWFHYSQAITKHWDDCKLVEPKSKKELGNGEKQKKAPKEILHLARNIPLLPKDDIKQGLLIIGNLIEKQLEEWPDLETFYNYLVKQWLNKAELLSSFFCVTKTNNKSEGFNRPLVKRMEGPKPELGTFLYNMHNIISTETIKSNQPGRAHRVTNQPEKNEKNLKIFENQAKLKNGELSIEEFLYEVLSEDMQQSIMQARYKEIEEEIQKENSEVAMKKLKEPVCTPEQMEPEYGATKRKASAKPATKRKRTSM